MLCMWYSVVISSITVNTITKWHEKNPPSMLLYSTVASSGLQATRTSILLAANLKVYEEIIRTVNHCIHTF